MLAFLKEKFFNAPSDKKLLKPSKKVELLPLINNAESFIQHYKEKLNKLNLDEFVSLLKKLELNIEFIYEKLSTLLLDELAFFIDQFSQRVSDVTPGKGQAFFKVLFDLVQNKLVSDANIITQTLKLFALEIKEVKEVPVKKISRKESSAKRSHLIIDSDTPHQQDYFIQEKQEARYYIKQGMTGSTCKVKLLFNSEDASQAENVLKKFTDSIGKDKKEQLEIDTSIKKEAQFATFYYDKLDQKHSPIHLFKRKWYWYMTLPYHAGLSLVCPVTKNKIKTFTIDQCLQLFQSGLECLWILHENYIIHGDVTPKNFILLEESFLLRLIDFGNTYRAWEVNNSGTPGFLSPWNNVSSRCNIDKINRAFHLDKYAMGVTATYLFPRLYNSEERPVRIHLDKEKITLKDQAIIDVINALLEKNLEQGCQIKDALHYVKKLRAMKEDGITVEVLKKLREETIDRTQLTVEDVQYQSLKPKKITI